MKHKTLKDVDKAFEKVYQALNEMLEVYKQLKPEDYQRTTFIGFYFNPANPDTMKSLHIGTIDDVLAKGGIVSLQEQLYVPRANEIKIQ